MHHEELELATPMCDASLHEWKHPAELIDDAPTFEIVGDDAEHVGYAIESDDDPSRLNDGVRGA